MLRITFLESVSEWTVKLEGRVVGPWVKELERAWEESRSRVAGRLVILDLRNVTFASTAGIAPLKRIHREMKARILAGSPLTQALADEIQSSKRGSG